MRPSIICNSACSGHARGRFTDDLLSRRCRRRSGGHRATAGSSYWDHWGCFAAGGGDQHVCAYRTSWALTIICSQLPPAITRRNAAAVDRELLHMESVQKWKHVKKYVWRGWCDTLRHVSLNVSELNESVPQLPPAIHTQQQ